MSELQRQLTGVPGLDDCLGGGLLPGTLTVIVGATGVGKTQLGLQFAIAGASQEGNRGVVFDVCARGDSQSHDDYAERMFRWKMLTARGDTNPALEAVFDAEAVRADYLHVFDYRGRRVTKQDLDWDQWRHWQAELNARLRSAIAFLYSNFIHGTRRVVIDGVEPAERPHESIQLNLFEYVYHQIIRKDPEWVARDLFRETFRAHAAQAERHVYPTDEIGCVLLYTAHESLLNEMIARPLDEGDALSNANTLIYMGKIQDGLQGRRAMYIAKHRGSSCSDRILPFEIDDQGVRIVGG